MKTIEWRDGKVRFLDQTRLPDAEIYIETDDYFIVSEAICTLRLRGAPLIGIAAAYAVVLAAASPEMAPADDEGIGGDPHPAGRILRAIDHLAGTRPTAVNLFAALDRMRVVVARQGDPASLVDRLLQVAISIHDEDIGMCSRISDLGAELLPADATVITHCNAGMLATGGIGTALGIISVAASRRKIRRVYVGETRPLFQGARLTAWELTRAGIDVTVLTDSSMPYLMSKNKIDAVIIGADRIAANGDVANKIGSYALALAASSHGIPFYVAAPTTTIDPALPAGDAIPIEERGAGELMYSGERRIIPEGASVWTPAFDVTPNNFVSAVITENGVHRQPFDFSRGITP